MPKIIHGSLKDASWKDSCGDGAVQVALTGLVCGELVCSGQTLDEWASEMTFAVANPSGSPFQYKANIQGLAAVSSCQGGVASRSFVLYREESVRKGRERRRILQFFASSLEIPCWAAFSLSNQSTSNAEIQPPTPTSAFHSLVLVPRCLSTGSAVPQ